MIALRGGNTYGQSLLVETEDGRFPLQWRQEGSTVILTRAEGEELTLSRASALTVTRCLRAEQAPNSFERSAWVGW